MKDGHFCFGDSAGKVKRKVGIRMENAKAQKQPVSCTMGRLFWEMFKISAFTFGGGFVIISVVCSIYTFFSENQIVQTALHVMRAGVAAVIVDVVIGLVKKLAVQGNVLNIVLMIGAFICNWFFKVSAGTVICLFLALSLARVLAAKMKGANA